MRFRWLIITLSLMLLLGAVAACGGGGGDDDDDDTSSTPVESGELPTQEGEPVDASDLAKAVVHIFALADGEPIWHGSGTIITKDGLILTNAHVVGTPEEQEGYDELAIGITEAEDRPASMDYVAEIRAVDYALDLAVIEITEEFGGGAVLEDFPFVSLGDSDEVGIGDEIRVLGYPGIGGETITFTRGAVSGFTSDRAIGDRAWIKTDATIAGGNSGGLAADEDGNLIGVPSVVGSGADSGITDCRILEDTNGDNVVDGNDTCVPVGGFINGIRPVKLALDLIDAVQNDDEYVSPYIDEEDIEDEPSGGFDTDDIVLSNLVFADGVTEDDEPTEVVKLLPSGITEVCAFWDYEGMQDGMTWDAIWYVDGEQNEAGSILGETWVGGDSGNWWACIFDEETGLTDGLYELIIQVEGENHGSDAIFVGGDRELVEFDLRNDSSFDICAAWVSPTGTQNWGFEDLGADVFLDAGTVVTLEVATGTYDILMKDCDANDVIEEYEIEISEDSVYTVTDS